MPFLRADLDYVNLVYDQPKNVGLSDKIIFLQFNEALNYNWHYQSISQGKIASGVSFRVFERCKMLRRFLCL